MALDYHPQEGEMKAVLSKAVGGPESLSFQEFEIAAPAPHQLLLDVKAVGVNYFDLLIIEDRYQARPPRPFAPGGEVAGIVRAAGSAADGFAAGDHVVAFCQWGGMAEAVLVDAQHCIPVAREVPFEKAAALLVTYGTALYALESKGRLRPGETLLVLGASGGLGLAVVELGRLLGARVVAGASSQAKVDLAVARGAHCGVVYPKGPLDPAAQRRLTDAFKSVCDDAADVVCDCVGGDTAEPAVRCTAWDGRYLIVGFAAGVPRVPFTLPLLKGCALVGVFWGGWVARDPQGFRRAALRLVRMLEQGTIDPLISKTLPLSRAGAAIAALADRSNVGKIVVTV
jgi:NADPH2:quinone reductase